MEMLPLHVWMVCVNVDAKQTQTGSDAFRIVAVLICGEPLQ
jgi:hypothetical protein